MNNSYLVTTITKDKDDEIQFNIERRQMRAVGPGAIEIVDFKLHFSTMVKSGDLVFLTTLPETTISDENSKNTITNMSVCILKQKPISIKVKGKEYIQKWLPESKY